MSNVILILPIMIFLHIVDDYYLQGILAKMKQKSWWEEVAPDPLYKHDYIIALLEHAFSWSFMINLPWIVYSFIYNNTYPIMIITSLIINTSIHYVVDDYKANKKIINLIQDQCCHFVQILATFLLYYCTIR